MVLTKQDFLIKAGLLVAATAVSSLQWSTALNPDGEALFHLGSLLPVVIFVAIVACIPGALFFGVVALTINKRTRDHTRACFLMGLYVVALWMVYSKVTQIADLPRPPSAIGGGSVFFWYVAYIYAFIGSLPGVGFARTQQQIDQEKAHQQQIAQRPETNRWLLVGASFLLFFTMTLIFGALTNVGFNLGMMGTSVMLGAGFAVLNGLRMLLIDTVDGRLRFWKITFPSLVRGNTTRSKTIDWSAMTKALIDSKNWNGLLLLTDDWLTAERGKHECWTAKGFAHEMLGDFHKAIFAYQVSLKIRYDETVAKRLDALVEERARQTRAREEQERKTKAEDERARERRTRNSSSNSEHTGSGRSRNRISLDHYFRILEIQPGATISEVKAAYKRQMQQYHPDKVASLGKELRDLAEAKSKEINEAFRAIMNALNT